MDTETEANKTPVAYLHPLAGWEAASRWNAATFDWMAKGFQQWLALVTTLPRNFLTPSNTGVPDALTARGSAVIEERPQAGPQRIAVRREARALAKEEPRRPARAKPKAARKAKARTRG